MELTNFGPERLDQIAQGFQEAKKHLQVSLLDSYVFNRDQLTEAEVSEVEGHMLSCEKCRTDIEEGISKKDHYIHGSRYVE